MTSEVTQASIIITNNMQQTFANETIQSLRLNVKQREHVCELLGPVNQLDKTATGLRRVN